ncbi:cytosine permease [Allobacillus sp. GCM10007491]|uniref:Cytosine permease n=1 Tax=Allobacillus saliphilus TaxID=2912308 RepID=A0A941CWE3_9BACI|nr:cytosine permease [Allobacillus saliphilus]
MNVQYSAHLSTVRIAVSTVRQLELKGGKYWYFKGVNLRAIIVWLVGVIFYLVINPLPLFTETVGAVYPIIVVTAVLYLIVSKINPKQ